MVKINLLGIEFTTGEKKGDQPVYEPEEVETNSPNTFYERRKLDPQPIVFTHLPTV